MASKEYELAVKIIGMMDNSFGNTVALTKKQIRQMAKEVSHANASTVSFSQAMQGMTPGIDKAWNTVVSGAKMAVGALTAVGTVAVGASASAIATGKEFEAAMSSWAGTASATQEEYDKVRQAAMEQGRQTSKTATEAANAMEYMALAGWDVNTSIAALPGVLKLSEAAGLDLATTSDLVTDSMSATGTSVEELTRFLDISATANNKSNQTAEQLLEAWIGVGGVLNNLNVPLEESAAALGMLSNRGIKGSEAGNALNAVIANMTTGTGQAGKMMDKLGISAFDSEGNFIGLKNTLIELDSATKDLTEEERNQALAMIGGKLHVDALNDLLQGLNNEVREGVTEWDELSDSLYNAEGALSKMAEIKMDNLEGDLKIMQSALDDSKIRFYEGISEPAREATQLATQAIYSFSENVSDKIAEWYPTVRRYMLEAGEAIKGFADPLLNLGKWVVSNGDTVIGSIAGIVTTIGMLKGASTLTNLASGVTSFVTAMLSNPVTAAIAVASLAAGAIVGITVKMKAAEKQAMKLNLAEHFGDITLSLAELKEASQEILGEDLFNKLALSTEAIEKVEESAMSVKNASKELTKISWKIGMGFELSESDMSSMTNSIDSMVNDSLSTIEDSQYALQLSISAMFGDSKEGDELISSFNSMYEDIHAEVEELGKKLGDAYNEAMVDGIIDTDEAKVIQELQEQLATITEQVANAQSEAKLDRIRHEMSGASLDSETYQNLVREMEETMDSMKTSSRDSYEYAMGALRLKFNRGEMVDENGNKLTGEAAQAMFEQETNILNSQLDSNLLEIDMKALDFQVNTANDAYSTEIEQFVNSQYDAIGDTLRNLVESENYSIDLYTEFMNISMYSADSLDKSTQNAIYELATQMQPLKDELESAKQELIAKGEEIPIELQNTLNRITTFEAMADSQSTSAYENIGNIIANDADYANLISQLEEKGYQIPQYVSDAIESNSHAVQAGANQLRTETEATLNDAFAEPFNVSAQVNVNMTGVDAVSAASAGTSAKKYARGGVVTSPTLGIIGEAGDTEIITPINTSANSARLWEETGRDLVNAGNPYISGSGESTQLTYSPNIVINGNANQSDVEKALETDYGRFKAFVKQYAREQQRVSY